MTILLLQYSLNVTRLILDATEKVYKGIHYNREIASMLILRRIEDCEEKRVWYLFTLVIF